MADAMLATCRTWIAGALPHLAEVFYMRQTGGPASAPRPQLPSVGIAWAGDSADWVTPYSFAYVADPENPDHPNLPHPADPDGLYTDFYQYRRRRRVLRVTHYGDDSFDDALDLEASLTQASDRALIRAAGLLIRPESAPVNTTALRSTKWEAAVTQDYRVAYVHENVTQIGVIENENVTLNGEDL